MKNFYILISMFLLSMAGKAQVSDLLQLSSSELQFHAADSFTQVSFQGCSFGSEAGAPQIPYRVVRYVLPFDRKVDSVRIDSLSSQTLGEAYRIYPVQPVHSLNEPPPAFVPPDTAIYTTSVPYPDVRVEIAGHVYDKGYHIVTLHVYPLAYTPSTGQLQVYTSIGFTLQLTANDAPGVRPRFQSESMRHLILNQIRAMVRNPLAVDGVQGGGTQLFPLNQPQPLHGAVPQSTYFAGSMPDYIIITNNTDINGNAVPLHEGKSMTEIFARLAEWKTKKGVPAVVVTVDEIKARYRGNDLQEQIRNYLKDIYENHYGCTYVLLGGDDNIIPVRSTYYKENLFFPSDLYYTAVHRSWDENQNGIYGEDEGDADETAEFYSGRAPAENAQEAQVFVSKVIGYETLGGVTDKNYVKNNLYIVAGTHGFMILPRINNIVDRLSAATQLTHWRIYDNPASWNGNEVLNRVNTLKRLNNGENTGKFHLVYHHDHSGYDGMGASLEIQGQSLSREDMDALVNTPYYQVMLSTGCSPGRFTEDCIAEHYLNNPLGGGAAILASSEESFPQEENFTHLCEYLYGMNDLSPVYNLGILHDMANVISAASSPMEFFYKRKNHLFGCPEMPVWTQAPRTFNVALSQSSISNVNNRLTVQVNNLDPAVLDKITVCLYKEGDIYMRVIDTEINSSSRSYQFPVSPQAYGTLYITVTGHNYLPYRDSIPAFVEGKNLFIHNLTVDDASAPVPNGQLDAGETVDLPLVLENNGSAYAQNVSATLSCTKYDESDAGDIVSILNTNPVYFGDVQAGFTKANLGNPFRIAVNSNAEDGTLLVFTLHITGMDYSEQRRFTLPVYASKLERVQNSYTTRINNDNSIDAGDEVSLYIDILNKGTGKAAGVTATLTSPASHITVNTGTVSYGDMDLFEQKANTVPFVFTTSQAYNGEKFILELQTASGTVIRNTFDLTIPSGALSWRQYTNTTNSITLEWYPYGLSKKYNIYRSSTVNGTYTRLNASPIENLAVYTDTELPSKTTYYYKVSYINDAGNESRLSAPCEAWTTFPYHPGFPVSLPEELGYTVIASPSVLDVNRDGNKEIFFATYKVGIRGTVYAFDHQGKELYGNPSAISGFANMEEEIWSTPSLADIDNDGCVEVVFSTRRQISDSQGTGTVFAYKTTGDRNGDGKPDRCWSANTTENIRGVILADLDHDASTLESVAPVVPNNISFPVINRNGAIYDNLAYGLPSKDDFYSTAAIADIDNDGNKEIVFVTGQGLFVYEKKEDGKYRLQWNKTEPLLPSYEYTSVPVVLADLDGDGDMEIVFLIRFALGNTGKKTKAVCCAVHHDGTFVAGWEPVENRSILSDSKVTTYLSNLAVGDIDNDGYPEVVMVGNKNLYVFDHTGNLFPGFPMRKEIDMTNKAPLLADVDGGGDLEIIVCGTDERLYAYKPDGTSAYGFPLEAGSIVTPCVADIDGDGKNEIIVIGNGMLYVWDTDGDSRKIAWGHVRHDERNTGAYKKEECISSASSLEVTANTVWNTDRVVLNNQVVIPDGITLTITSTVYLSGKIVVRPGGKLIVDGGVLTNTCDGEVWRGIEVWGQNNAIQTNDLQGTVELKNNARIENAVCGIYLGNKLALYWNQHSHSPAIISRYGGGGIIKAQNAHFINNQQAVYFAPYICYYDNTFQNNQSQFKNCQFLLDDASLFEQAGKAQVELQGVRGVPFADCVFADDRSKTSLTKFTSGIHANASSIKIGSAYMSPLNYAGCSFRNFDKAISIQNSGIHASQVYSSEFGGNNMAIDAWAANSLVVEGCHFGNPHTVYSPDQGIYGIYLDRSYGYTILNNYFTGGGTGMLVENSGAGNHIVKNNTFDNLCVACLVRGNNSDGGEGSQAQGLAFRCNTFDRNESDISIAADGTIRYLQSGENSALATGNRFFYSVVNIANEYVSPFEYQYVSSDISHLPLYILNLTGVILSGRNRDDCRSYGYGGDSYYQTALQQDLGTLDVNYDEAHMSHILKKEMYENNGYSVNPIEWNDPEVRSIVDRLTLMPDNITITIDGTTPTSVFEQQVVLYYELTNLQQRMDVSCYSALELLSTDTSGLNIGEYRKWMGRLNTVESQYLLVDSYIIFNDFSQAEMILEQMPLIFEGMDTEAHQNYLDYYYVVRDLYFPDTETYEEFYPYLTEELIRYSLENNTLTTELTDKFSRELIYCFMENGELPTYFQSELIGIIPLEVMNDFIHGQEPYPLEDGSILPPELKNELVRYLREELPSDMIGEWRHNLLKDRRCYYYWIYDFASFGSPDGIVLDQEMIDYYYWHGLPAEFIAGVYQFFDDMYHSGGEFSPDYWANIMIRAFEEQNAMPYYIINMLKDYIRANPKDELTRSLFFYSITRGMHHEALYELIHPYITNNTFIHHWPDELIPCVTADRERLPSLLFELSYSFVQTHTAFSHWQGQLDYTTRELPSDFLGELIRYFAGENEPGLYGEEIPLHLEQEIIRLSSNNDYAGIRSYSLGEQLFPDWEIKTVTIRRTIEEYSYCVYQFNPLWKSISGNNKDNSFEEKANNAGKMQLSVYPNPADNILYIELYNLPKTPVDYILYDMQGKQLSRGNFNSRKHEMDISSLSTGVYFLHFKTEDCTPVVKKVIKN